MKKSILFFLFITIASIISAQDKASGFSGKDTEQRRDPRADQMNFVPNEVIVKFKDAVHVQLGARMKVAGVNNVDKVLKAYGVTVLDKLFPAEQKPLRTRMMRSPQGKEFKVPALDKIYKISIPPATTNTNTPTSIFQLIEELKAQPEVEYAEPNYIYSIDAMQPVGPILTAYDVKKLQSDKPKNTKASYLPNDPLYGQQWYIPAVKADLVWEQTLGDSTQIIAILDTGVDWNHPDLKNKIWINTSQLKIKNIDGILNDIRGWDFINKDNDPMDDNSHGTHVAGIAAAETNNGIGIAGVCPKARIMPIKVFQSSGRGDASTIAKGIHYAATHGATVINMSFGSYARSLAMEDALANAYSTTVLVAAAGNDGLGIGPCSGCAPFFPAAFSFVLGVQSPEASFTNFDQDGPTYSEYSDLLNYEMKAPGTNIISTIPNGNYRIYQGTSMAAPIVSGALSLYRKLIPSDIETNEFMWVKLIQSIGQYLDVNKALTIVPKPEVQFLNKVMVDTIGIDDKDGRVDAGETIQLWFKARNTGGQVDSVYWKIRLAEFEDPTTCTIVKPTSFLSSISPYATRTSESDPMKFVISNNVVHDRDITFDLLSWYKGSADTLKQKFVFTPENGEQLSGVLDTIKTLYPNRQYLVNNSFKIGNNGTLIIKPGTKILIYNGKPIVVKGGVIAIGKPDSLIQITGYSPPPYFGNARNAFEIQSPDYVYTPGVPMKYPKRQFDYCYFEKFTLTFGDNYMGANPKPNVSNSTFYYTGPILKVGKFFNNKCISVSYYGEFISGDSIINNNFIGNPTSSSFYVSDMGSGLSTVGDTYFVKNNNFINMSMGSGGNGQPFLSDPKQKNAWISEYSKLRRSWNGTFYQDIRFILTKFNTYNYNKPDFLKCQNQYWGTTDSTKIEGFIEDFMEYPSQPRAVFKPLLNAPPEECHGVVWKVLVNGKDAQDEKVEPVGVGKQRFDVYFNRPMDKTFAPQVAFGVRYPFSSNAVDEEGSWSADGRIYTVYKSVKLFTGDGINRVRVTGAKDLEGWEIPLEDMRFEFLVSAAASASAEFMASPGLGKVKLEWNNNSLADGLGFNMYRMEHVNDTVLTKPVVVNKTLITDTLYTDFTVTPNKKYYYYYKILRTNLAETDSSRVVSAIPFTASKGDANGDLSVNVLDISSIVAWLLNNNPQPFISEAADMNSDGNINVLDIVGVVNLVLNGPQKVRGAAIDQQADLYMENDTLFADANVAIGGIQFDMSGVASVDEIKALKALDGFESGYAATENGLRLLYYSMSGKSIAAGNHIPLMVMKNGSKIVNAVFGGTKGSTIKVNYVMTRIGNINNNMNQVVAELGQNYPNPLNNQTAIPVRINEPVDEAVLRIVNMVGQEVEIIRLSHPAVGEHILQWDAHKNKGLFVYTLEIISGNQKVICPIKKMIVQ